MSGAPSRRPRRAGRLFLLAAALFLVAAWQHPQSRTGSIALAVVFGIIGANQMRSD